LVNPAGSAPLPYSTYLGGSGFDQGNGIAVDASGSAYVTGRTDSANFPTTLGAFDTTPNGGGDAFVTKLDAIGFGRRSVVSRQRLWLPTRGWRPIGLPRHRRPPSSISPTLHTSPLGMDFAQEVARSFQVDLVIDTGDITSFGTPLETAILERIPAFDLPYIFVRGNHDAPAVGDAIEALPNASVLEGEAQSDPTGDRPFSADFGGSLHTGARLAHSSLTEAYVAGIAPLLVI
jgi:hypothetical protein